MYEVAKDTLLTASTAKLYRLPTKSSQPADSGNLLIPRIFSTGGILRQMAKHCCLSKTIPHLTLVQVLHYEHHRAQGAFSKVVLSFRAEVHRRLSLADWEMQQDMVQLWQIKTLVVTVQLMGALTGRLDM